MKIDCLVAEIGSTTTVVNAFNIHQGPVRFMGRGMHATTVDSDVNIGLEHAITNLKKNLNVDELTYDELFASSSAAGGLKITVHGLVYEMTAKAAKHAALNAGANIHLITANDLEDDHIDLIKTIKPNIIIIAGGTDFGEKETAFSNLIKVIPLNIPIIYAGNQSNHHRIQKLNCPLIKIVDNVYPRVDDFNIMPLRKVIYQTFEENIIHAKGMKDIFKKVNQTIIPTPGAVMDATLVLYDMIDGVITIDVGGATTDVHSVCQISPEYLKYNDGEPLFKRTVEGDLGVFINRALVHQLFKKQELELKTGFKTDYIDSLMIKEPFIPITSDGKILIETMTEKCVHIALDRHIGDLKRVFTTNGIKVIPEGKDLTMARAIFLTGGALLHADDPIGMVQSYLEKQHTKLSPKSTTPIYIDHEYIFASIGVLSHKYPEKAKLLLEQTLRWET